MLTKRSLVFLMLILFIGSSSFVLAQRKRGSEGFKENHSPFGRRKKEKINQKFFARRAGGGFFKLFGGKSKGNADFFAGNRIIGKKGFFASLFRPKYSGNASLRRTKSIGKEDSKLFKRNRTSAKISFRKKQERQNRKRERNRGRGNVLFSKRKR